MSLASHAYKRLCELYGQVLRRTRQRNARLFAPDRATVGPPTLESLERRVMLSGADYALLFSGGGDPASNHARYYETTKLMYETLVNRCGLDPQNIFIQFADGTDPGLDQNTGLRDAMGDWILVDSVMSYAQNVAEATHDNLRDRLANLAGVLDDDDHFLLWTFDHGNGDNDRIVDEWPAIAKEHNHGEETLVGWGDSIEDNELADWLTDVRSNTGWFTAVFGQCFSGGMLTALQPLGNNEFGCAATNHYEVSYGNGFVAAFTEGLENGLRWTNDLFGYAYDNDPYQVNGSEHPWSRGENFSIFGRVADYMSTDSSARTYSFTGDAGDLVKIQLTGGSFFDWFDPAVVLFGPSQTPQYISSDTQTDDFLRYSEDNPGFFGLWNTDPADIDVLLLEDGVYTIQVQTDPDATGGNAAGPYTLTVTKEHHDPAAQQFYLDFSGFIAGNVTSEFPDLTGDATTLRNEIIAATENRLNEIFADYHISFSTSVPSSGDYSTITFSAAGFFGPGNDVLGMADQIDYGNTDHTDGGTVYWNHFAPELSYTSAEDVGQAFGTTAAHIGGLSMGLRHVDAFLPGQDLMGMLFSRDNLLLPVGFGVYDLYEAETTFFFLEFENLWVHGKQDSAGILRQTVGSKAVTRVVTTSPALGAASVRADTSIVISFDKGIAESTVEGNVSVTGSTSGAHSFSSSFDPSTHRLTIDPDVDFSANETVQVTISTGLRFIDGTSLASDYTLEFTTKAGSSSGSHAEWSMSWFIQDALSDAYNHAVDWRDSLEAQSDIRNVSLRTVGDPSIGELLVEHESGVAGNETIHGVLQVTQSYEVMYERRFKRCISTPFGSFCFYYWEGGYSQGNSFTGTGETRNSGTGSVNIAGTGDGDQIRFAGVLADSQVDGGAGNDSLNLGNTVGPAVILGGSGNDVLIGGSGDDEIEGGPGEDQIDGRAGNDTIRGGSENDSITGGTGNDTIHGDGGDDGIVAGDGADTVHGDDGNDTIMAGAGADTVYGGSGNDILWGGTGNDQIQGDSGQDTIHGDAGADTISGGTHDDWISGGAGDDEIDGQQGNDTLAGDAGADLISGGVGSDTISGGSGNDTLHGDEGDDAIAGNDGDDTAYGDAGADTIHGNAGNDTLSGGDGPDSVYGDGGNDTIEGNDDADDLHGGSGDDTINGNSGNDTIHGGDDADLIHGDAGNDTIYGGANADLIYGDTGNDLIHGDSGNDDIYGGEGDDHVYGDADEDLIHGDEDDDLLLGGSGDDEIRGDTGDDTIHGNSGEDLIYGDAGDDLIHGNTGNDTIHGGTGTDTIYGDQDDDVVYGNEGPDVIYGGADDDLLHGNDGNDIVMGDDGSAELGSYAQTAVVGSDGNDQIYGDAGADILLGGGANDTIVGDNDENGSAISNPGADVIIGDGGSVQMSGDTILQAEANDASEGAGGADTIEGNELADIILGGAGGDTIYGNDGNDALVGDDGRVRLNVGSSEGGDGDPATIDIVETINPTIGGPDTIHGGLGDDAIIGGSAGDSLHGDGGSENIVGDQGRIAYRYGDLIYAVTTGAAESHGGDDTINGGEEVDVILAGLGNDLVHGHGDNDIVIGDEGLVRYDLSTAEGGDGNPATFDLAETQSPSLGGADTLHGDDGNDVVIGGSTGDTLNGNAGDDVLVGDQGRVESVNALITRIEATDTAEGDGGVDVIHGDVGDDVILGGVAGDQLAGDADDDVIVGDEGLLRYDVGTADGGDGNPQTLDQIVTTEFGLGGSDAIEGNAGQDVILAGTAGDTVYGNTGADIAIGDQGQVLFVNASVTRIETTDTAENDGGADTVNGNEGDDIILGGVAGDLLSGNEADDILVGDEGLLRYSITTTEGGDGNPLTLDLIQTGSTTLGGADTIYGNGGNDIAMGGRAGDGIYGDNGDLGSAADAGNDTLIGDGARMDFFDGCVTAIATIDPFSGGADTIEGSEWHDVIIGGMDGDWLYGEAADVARALPAGEDTILGDNGRLDFVLSWDTVEGRPDVGVITLDPDSATLDRIMTTDPTAGAPDFIYGNGASDIIFGGTAGDVINGDTSDEPRGDDGNDLIFGDHGKVFPQLPANNNFFAIDTGADDAGADDLIYGNGAHDTILGQQGDDRLYGGAGDDDLFGGHNVQGGIDEMDASDRNDTMDGGSEDDVLAGDNAIITRRDDAVTSRFRYLNGKELYTKDHEANVGNVWRANPTGARGRDVVLLDHSFGPDAGTFGDDYMAGGAHEDMIFGQLGNDIIQGDASVAETVAPDDPSVEAADDGNDYIEGNGGEDLIFGNNGQDDIIGGSSDLFGLVDAYLRPDGSDLIFGGAGTDTGRNVAGDTSEGGHARDADFILGDNGVIYRPVGVAAGETVDLTFNHDGYAGDLRIIARTRDLLDYTPGSGSADDIGARDIIHGESGDDIILGMVGDDSLFGEGQDDDLYGNAGDDWISGGTGNDGVLGDDGLILTSRNGLAEPLYGVVSIPRKQLDLYISTPGSIQTAVINVSGQLKKAVDLEPFDLGGNDIIYGGLGNDALHGGAGDDAISGAEAQVDFYAAAQPEADVLEFGKTDPEEFAAYDEDNPLAKIDGFLLNFDALDAAGAKVNDGNDVLFGDLGNDWLVGGTNNDNLYGGYGNDLLNVDDNLDTNGGANDITDPQPFADGDRAYGGAGRDVLIANTGGDRLIDWVGEFNSYLVPFAPYGMTTVSRTLQPHLADFLLDLSASDGADQTRITPGGGSPSRNGEPFGELGMVRQRDNDWKDQMGPPDDPQAGNIPGGKRDGRFVDDLHPKAHTLTEDQPEGFVDGDESVGILGGTVDNSQDSNVITGIVIQTDDPDAPAADSGEDAGLTPVVETAPAPNNPPEPSPIPAAETPIPDSPPDPSPIPVVETPDPSPIPVVQTADVDNGEEPNPVEVVESYGFTVTEYGVGDCIVNVGSNGDAFGVEDGSEPTVLDLLLATNEMTVNGVLYDVDGDGSIDKLEQTLRTMANEVYSGINEQGDIPAAETDEAEGEGELGIDGVIVPPPGPTI